MVSERSEGATKGLRVINSVDLCVLKSNFFIDYRLVTVPLLLPVTSRQREMQQQLVVTSPGNSNFI